MNKDLNTIWDILPDARLVGGCVRDKLMGLEPHDYDFCTEKLPEEVMDIFSTNGFQVIPTGLQHGTVTIVVNDNTYEITTLRTDDETDGRHAKVSFTKSWESDSKRRDFSMNALYMDSEGNIYDYHNGIEDIKNKRIKFIGNAEDRIKEDSLRILRYYRFMTKFKNFNTDSSDIKAIKENIKLMRNLSIERIYSELTKIFSSENKWPIIELMNEHGISKSLLNKDIPVPKTKINIDYLTVFSSLDIRTPDYMRNFKAPLHDIKHINDVASIEIIDYNINENYIKNLLLFYDRDVIISKAYVSMMYYVFDIEKWEKFKKLVNDTNAPIFPVKGGDLLKKGIKGKEIGDTMRLLKDRWIYSNYQLTKEELIEFFGSDNHVDEE